MSKQIENNVVQMTFDNKDFEKNISTSTKSIEKLNEDLKFKDANKGFQDLEKYANSVNFSGLTKAIENINSVFTVTGALSKKIIDDVAGYFESKILGAVNTVRNNISYVMSFTNGVQKYEQYTTAMNTMVANMTDQDRIRFESRKNFGDIETELEYIENHMDRILKYADETSYSFTDMADAVAKYTASNVPLEEASNAIMGMANVAAVAGQNATQATMSMQQLAQAFGVGYVQYQDWKQAFVTKNMVTKELKKTLVDAAVGLTLDDEDIKKARAQLGDSYYDFFFSSDMLRQGWLRTNDVLINGLNEYSKASSLIIDNIENLNDEGWVAVSGILEIVHDFKDQAGELNAKQFVEMVADDYNIQNVELMTEMLEKLASAEYELSLKAFEAGQNATNFHEAIEATRDAVGSRFLKILEYFIGNLDQAKKLWTGFANTMYDVLAAPLEHVQEGMEQFNKCIAETVEIEGKLVEITWYDKFWDGVRRAFGGAGGIITDFLDIFREFEGSVREKTIKDGEKITETISIFKKYTFDFMKKLTQKVNDLADMIEKFRKSKFLKELLSTFNNVLKTIRNIRKTINLITGSTLSIFLRNLKNPLTLTAELTNKLSEKMAKLSGNLLNSPRFNRFIEAIGRLTSKLMELSNKVLVKISDLIIKILSKLGDIIIKLSDYLLPVIDFIIDGIDRYLIPLLDELIDGPYSIGNALDWLGDKIVWAMEKVEDFFESVTGMSFGDAKESIGDYADFVKEKFKDLGGGIFDIFAKFFSSSIDPDEKGTIPNIFKRLIEANSLVEGAQNVVEWSGDALMRPIKLILDVAGMFLGIDLTKLADAISSFIHSFTDSLVEITPDVFNFIEKIGDFVLKTLKLAYDIVIGIVKYVVGISDTTGFNMLDKIIAAIKTLFMSVIDVFVYLLEKIATLTKLATPAIKEFVDWFGNFLKDLVKLFKDSFQSLVEIKDPDTFASYVMKALKFAIGLFVLAKITVLIEDIIYMFSSFRRTARLFGLSTHLVADSLSGLLDSWAGDSISGRLRMFAFVLLSFGYALAQIAKVGEMMAKEDLREGVIYAGLLMIGLMLVLTMLIKSMSKTQAKLQKSIIDFASHKLTSKEVGNMQSSFSGMGSMLFGLGIALIGIASGVAILAKAIKTTSKDDIIYASASIGFILLFLGFFMKLSNVWQKSEKDLNLWGKKEGSKYNSKKSGYTYKGVAAVLLSFAASMLLIAPAMSLMALACKHVGHEKWWDITESVAIILLVIGIVLSAIVHFSENLRFFNAVSLIGLLNAMTLAIIQIMAVMAGIIYLIGGSFMGTKIIDPKAYHTVEKVMEFIVWMMGITGAIIVAINYSSSKYGWKRDLTKLLRFVASTFLVGIAFSSLSVSIVSIVFAIAKLANVLVKYDLKSFLDPNVKDNPLFNAIMIILALFGFITLVTIVLSKAIKGNKEETWKEIAARVAGISLWIFMIQGFMVIMVGLVSLLAWLMHFKSVGDTIGTATAILVQIMVAIAGFIAVIALLGKLLTLGRKKTAYDVSPSTELLKLAGAIMAISVAITIMAGALLGIGKASKLMGDGVLLDGIIAFGTALGVVLVAILGFAIINRIAGNAITILCGLLKALLIALVAVIAAVIIMGKFGDKMAVWLEQAEPKIREGFKALGHAMTAAIEGFNEALPEVLLALAETIAIILDWIGLNIEDWTYDLTVILCKMLDGFTSALYDESVGIGLSLHRLMEALGAIIIVWIKGPLADGIDEGIQYILEREGDSLLRRIPGIGDLILSAEQDQANKSLKIEQDYQKQKMEMRKKAALKYLDLIDEMERAEMALQYWNALDGREAEIQRKSWEQQQEASRKKLEQMFESEYDSDADKLFAFTGIDIAKTSSEQSKWWEYYENSANLMQRNWFEDFSRDKSMPFVDSNGNVTWNKIEKAQEKEYATMPNGTILSWNKGENPPSPVTNPEDYIFLENGRIVSKRYYNDDGSQRTEANTNIPVHGKSYVTMPNGTVLSWEGENTPSPVTNPEDYIFLENGRIVSKRYYNDDGSRRTEINTNIPVHGTVIEPEETKEEKRQKKLADYVETIKDYLVDKKDAAINKFKDSEIFSNAKDTFTKIFGTDTFTSQFKDNFNVDSYTNLDLSNASISSLDGVNYIPEATDYYQNAGDLSYTGTLDTGYTNDQLNAINANTFDSSEIAIKIDEAIEKLDTIAEGMKEVEIKVDEETTIAWLITPIDEIIGKKQHLNAGRRIGVK